MLAQSLVDSLAAAARTIQHSQTTSDASNPSSPERAAIDSFQGEWIVFVNRGAGRRDISNADALHAHLLRVFPDHSNPHLRVYPIVLNYGTQMSSLAPMMRRTRLVIGTHGAGFANIVMMRPGAAILELNSFKCEYVSLNFR